MKLTRYLSDLLPTTTTERDPSVISRASATLRRLDMERERLLAEFRGPVSATSAEGRLEELESFAARLIRENIAKQAKPEIVARNVRRTSRLLKDAFIPSELRRTARPTSAIKRYDQAFQAKSWAVRNPRTVFGTEAWIGRRLKHMAHLNPRFATRLLALPCVERTTRKEVLFARGKAAKGYRGHRRRSTFSDIWC